MSNPLDHVIETVASVISVETTECVQKPAPGRFVRAYVERYTRRRIVRAYMALEDGNSELAREEISSYVHGTYGISPWARHILRRFIGEV